MDTNKHIQTTLREYIRGIIETEVQNKNIFSYFNNIFNIDKFIGGANGLVFSTKDNKVLKITTDLTNISNYGYEKSIYENGNIEGVVKIYDYGKLSIPKEFLNDNDIAIIDNNNKYSFETDNGEVIYVLMEKLYDFEKASNVVYNLYRNLGQLGIHEVNPKNLKCAYEIRKLIKPTLRQYYDRLCYIFKKISDNDINWLDSNPHNFGFNKAGELVAFDVNNYILK